MPPSVQSSVKHLLLASLLTAPLAAAPALETVLANMDKASASWQGMRAKAEWVKYMSLVDDRSVETGEIVVRRVKPSGVEFKLEFTEPNHYFLAVSGKKVEIYKPKIATVEEYDVGDSRAKLQEALALGFGTAGKALMTDYDVSVTGEETVFGEETVKLELLPKSAETKKNVTRVEMWISTARWQPVQQKLYEISEGDYRIYAYSDVETNPKFSSDDFKLKLARGTKRVRPQR